MATVGAPVEPAPPWSWLGWGVLGVVIAALVARGARRGRCENDAPMTVHLLTGDDESILRAAVSELVHELVGDGDRSLMVDEFDGDDVRGAAVSSTPPRPRRSSPSGASSSPATSGGSPPTSWRRSSPTSPTRCRRTELVLVGGGGRLAKALTDARRSGRRHRAHDHAAVAGAIARLDRRRGRRAGVRLVPAAASDRRAAR